MATTTPNYGWTVPTSTDLVKDGATAIETLGDSVDATVKALNPETTLGDIAYRSATANTNTRLGIGTTGQVLSVVGGVPAWTTSSAASLSVTPTGKNLYVRTPFGVYGGSNTLTEDVTYYTPVYLPDCTLDRISIRTSTGYSGTSTIRLGIYNNSANNLPGTVLLDAGTVSATASSTNYEVTISQVITKGIYWLALNGQTLGAGPDLIGSAVGPNTLMMNFVSISTNNRQLQGWYETGVTGAFATAGTLTASESSPIAFVRVS